MENSLLLFVKSLLLLLFLRFENVLNVDNLVVDFYNFLLFKF